MSSNVTAFDLTGVLVPRGVWHRLAVREPRRLLFVTPGEGTEHRAVAV